MSAFTPTLRAELAKLDTLQVLDLLGEIVEPSIHSPFATPEDFDEAMIPVTEAYRKAYADLVRLARWEPLTEVERINAHRVAA